MGIKLEDIKEHIPYYLTQEAKDGLIKELKNFPDKMNYYTTKHQDGVLQGDGWDSFSIIDLETAQRKSTKGIILSNSCDINQENYRDIPARIIFAPIIKLSRYEALLTKTVFDPEKISMKMSSIRRQNMTSLFYLPKGGCLESEYIALLDDLHTLPVQLFCKTDERTKQFTLSQAGFYLFLFKLSIHFCRFHENVLRDNEPQQTN